MSLQAILYQVEHSIKGAVGLLPKGGPHQATVPIAGQMKFCLNEDHRGECVLESC